MKKFKKKTQKKKNKQKTRTRKTISNRNVPEVAERAMYFVIIFL